LSVWVIVIIIRRRRRRHRRTGGIRGRQKRRVPDEEADQKQEIAENAERRERRSPDQSLSHYLPTDKAGDEFKFDP